MTAAPTAFDPRDPAFRSDPYPVLRRLREDDPVHWSEAMEAWVLTRYDDVKLALADSRFSADRISPFRDSLAERARERIADLLTILGEWMVFNDPPKHRRLRALAGRAFSPRVDEGLIPRIEAIVDRLIDRAGEAGRMELIGDFATPLPILVIAHLLGLPGSDEDKIKTWSDEVATFVGSAQDVPDKRRRAQDAIAETLDYLRAVVARRRSDPRDDVISDLVAARESGDFDSDDELLGTCTLLLFAGHETTTNLIGNGMLALLGHPDQYGLLAADPDLAAGAVEECLRFDGPAPAMTRIARLDVALDGGTIRAGDRVFAMLGAANRDPARFDDPDRLVITRQDNRHLAFGYGTHFCLGAPLARLEGGIALRALATRLDRPALAQEDLRWRDSLSLRGLESLNITFQPAARRAASA